MTLAIALKDLTIYLRSGVFISLAVAMIALFAAAAALSSQRVETFERERIAAEMTDRNVWDRQGKRNPHAAAHFARYAFKPIPRSVAFDPGVTDHAGIALWMEAHYQNPAVFRRAEDLGDAGRMADLSPAWILQFAAPLFIFLILFGAVSGEREAGTLRQIATTGVRSGHVLTGKLLAAGAALFIIVVPAAALSLWMIGGADAGTVLPDSGLRSVGLILIYTLFIAGLCAFAIGVSALFKEKRSALVVLVALWAVSFVMVPRLASSVAAAAYPQPDAVALSDELAAAAGAAREDQAFQEEIRNAVLAEYGVVAIEELPINYTAYTLQKTEEYAHPIFEEIYERLNTIYRNQETVLRAAALIAPVVALQKLSAGLAGTDRLHHNAFTASAELHRRKSVKLLNDDFMLNGAGQQRYAADEALWAQVEDFDYTPPRFTEVALQYGFSFFVLGFYAFAAFWFAQWALNRAQKRIAA